MNGGGLRLDIAMPGRLLLSNQLWDNRRTRVMLQLKTDKQLKVFSSLDSEKSGN